MEHDYKLNPGVEILLQQIEPGSREAPVQALVEVILWTVFPASDRWMTLTKHSQGPTEPDTYTAKLCSFNAGHAPVDILYGELKRAKEDVAMKHFARVSRDQLDDHMRQSSNPDGTTLFGLTGIGQHVVFYEKILPDGELRPLVDRPLHWWDDSQTIQGWFDYFKGHVPSVTPAAAAAPPAAAAAVAVAGPAAAPAYPAEPAEVFPSQYYYVTNGQYFYNDNGNSIPQAARPEDRWVYNANGWSDTGRTMKWRKAIGRQVEYR